MMRVIEIWLYHTCIHTYVIVLSTSLVESLCLYIYHVLFSSVVSSFMSGSLCLSIMGVPVLSLCRSVVNQVNVRQVSLVLVMS